LQYLEDGGLSWNGPLFFSNGSAITHPKVEYAWLTKAVPRILDLADTIAARPIRRSHTVPLVRPPGAGKLFLQETVALLRRNSRAMLDEDPSGPVRVGVRRYAPRAVVSGRLERSFDICGNRRATELLMLSADLCRGLRDEARIPKDVR